MIYLISYDLNEPQQNYPLVIEAIKKYQHCHVMQSLWFISTNENIREVTEKLMNCIDDNDWLFVCPIGLDYDGILPKDKANWLRRVKKD